MPVTLSHSPFVFPSPPSSSSSPSSSVRSPYTLRHHHHHHHHHAHVPSPSALQPLVSPSPYHYYLAPSPYTDSPLAHTHTLPPHNNVRLTRSFLHQILTDLSTRLLSSFGHQVTLLTHGGAVMVLHPDLGHRGENGTRDVDIVRRAFVEEYTRRGVSDAGKRLDWAVEGTAVKFGLGKDWMNGAPDVALPMALDPKSQRIYDPIHAASSTSSSTTSSSSSDITYRTIFTSPGLRLLAITWPWALALKLTRYASQDAKDARAIVRLLYWKCYGEECASVDGVERLLRRECWWAMGFEMWDERRRKEMRGRVKDAVNGARESSSY